MGGSSWLLLMLATVLVDAVSLPSPASYQALAGHQVWEAEDQAAMSLVSELEQDGLADILGHSGASLRFRVFPESQGRASDTLLGAGVKYRVLIDDLGRHSAESARMEQQIASKRQLRESCTSESCSEPFIEDFMRFEEMEWYLQDLAAQFERVEVKSIGQSHEGRNIWMVHIKAAQEGEGQRKTVWLEGGIHAREWISPAVTLNLIHKIASSASYLPDNVDVYAVPMSNPDGYVFTWTDNRYWRKNRRVNDNAACSGVDLNRNWDYKYGVGASSRQCSEVYKGPNAFSEPETKALSTEMAAVKSNTDLRLMVALHCYGQVLLYPWGWTTDAAPTSEDMIREGQEFATAAWKVHGAKYTVANSAGGFYYASGTTDDWALGKLEIPYSYTLELPDDGQYGFTLPANRIRYVVDDVTRGFKRIVTGIYAA